MISLSQYFENDFIVAPMGSFKQILTSPTCPVKFMNNSKNKKNKLKKEQYDVKESYNILDENFNLNSEIYSPNNIIHVKPQGIIIQDSYNNPFFPITPLPRVDTSKSNLPKIYQRYRELYTSYTTDYLPWHYCIELIDDRYTVFNTRPSNLKFPKSNNDINSHNLNLDDIGNSFFKNNTIDISNSIHILIIGDTSLDIYTKKIYKIIGRICISPFLRYFKLPNAVFQRVFPLNIGKKFTVNMLEKYIR